MFHNLTFEVAARQGAVHSGGSTVAQHESPTSGGSRFSDKVHDMSDRDRIIILQDIQYNPGAGHSGPLASGSPEAQYSTWRTHAAAAFLRAAALLASFSR